MGSGRDATASAAGLERWLAADRATAAVEVVRCESPAAGLSSETLVIDARVDGHDESFVVRLAPPEAGPFATYDLGVQCDVAAFVAAHGVPAPRARHVADRQWLGAPFMVMPFVDGHIPDAMPIVDDWITSLPVPSRRRLYDETVETLARLHRIDVDAVPASIPRRDLAAELDEWARYLGWYADGEALVPVLHRAHEWCATNRPPDPPPSLLWGDVRLGNVVYDDDAHLVGVLDWEMTTVGAAEHDVAWWQVLERVQDQMIGRRVQGFPSLDEARASYERLVGRGLQHLEWFEVFAMLRSTALMTRIAIGIERRGGRPMLPVTDNPLLDLLGQMINEAGATTS